MYHFKDNNYFLLSYIFFLDELSQERNGNIIENKILKRQQKYKNSLKCMKNYAQMQPSELYKAINKMDCKMHRLRLNCPIHNIIF